MSKVEMNSDTKEFFIERVESYSSASNQASSHIIVSITCLGMMSISAIAGNVVLSTVAGTSLVTVARTLLNLGIGGFSISLMILLVKRIALKIGMDAKIEVIKEFFAHHGLILEDEVSISKGK